MFALKTHIKWSAPTADCSVAVKSVEEEISGMKIATIVVRPASTWDRFVRI